MQFSCMFHRSTTQSDSILVKLTNRNATNTRNASWLEAERERETVPRFEQQQRMHGPAF